MSAAQQLVQLCALSRLLWEAALESAERDGDQGRAHAAEADGEASNDAWQDALELVEDGDLFGAKRALAEARWLAANWGDDSPERQAMALLDGAAN